MRWRDFDDLLPLPDSFFQRPRRIHFVGVGGIGMSALAFALRGRGHDVSGSDASESPMLERLREAGVRTVIGHSTENLHVFGETCDAIIFGSAIAENNAERVAARDGDIPEWHRAQLLAYFVNNAKFSIAVSGTHGKSTTSAMIAHILEKLGHNPTALLGAEYPPFGSNVRLGDENLVVVEADESDGSFTLLHPTIGVVTNVEPEHLENYSDSETELWRAFKQFAEQTREALVLNADDEPLLAALDPKGRERNYGLGNRAAAVFGENLRVENRATLFDVHWGAKALGTFRLGAPGEHNVSNALAALVAADTWNETCSGEAWGAKQRAGLVELLADFHGVKRRFEFVGEADDILVYNDYGHHPTEVARTVETAREFLDRPVVAIFQPHRYSRTLQLGHEFGPSFEQADRVIITELYSAFEEPIPGVSGQIVLDAVRAANPVKQVYFAPTLEDAHRLAMEITLPGDALFCLGAGNIGALPARLLESLQEREMAQSAVTS